MWFLHAAIDQGLCQSRDMKGWHGARSNMGVRGAGKCTSLPPLYIFYGKKIQYHNTRCDISMAIGCAGHFHDITHSTL